MTWGQIKAAMGGAKRDPDVKGTAVIQKVGAQRFFLCFSCSSSSSSSACFCPLAFLVLCFFLSSGFSCPLAFLVRVRPGTCRQLCLLLPWKLSESHPALPGD